MKRRRRFFWVRLGRGIRRPFIAGLIAVVPLTVTVLILVWVFNQVDGILQPIIEGFWGRSFPGVGFGVALVLVYLIGVIASNVLGRRMIRYIESAVPFLPVIRQLYTGTRQIMDSFSAPRKTGYMHVVLVEFPRKGTRVLGFITNEIGEENGKKIYTVFVPTSPNPTSGFLQILEEDEIIRTDITVENALKMVVSGGRVVPAELSKKLLSSID